MNIEYISGMGYPIHFHGTESSFVEMWERIMRQKKLDWSQSKIFLVTVKNLRLMLEAPHALLWCC